MSVIKLQGTPKKFLYSNNFSNMQNDQPAFVEKQFLGRDYGRISIRMVMALFCFAAYFITEKREENAALFLVVGCGILVVSVIMMFLLHYKTTVKTRV